MSRSPSTAIVSSIRFTLPIASASTTINKGHMPLSVKVKAIDAKQGIFEALTTAPEDDPIAKVELWQNGNVIATATEAPYRLTAPAALEGGFVQITARTKSGEEAA